MLPDNSFMQNLLGCKSVGIHDVYNEHTNDKLIVNSSLHAYELLIMYTH